MVKVGLISRNVFSGVAKGRSKCVHKDNFYFSGVFPWYQYSGRKLVCLCWLLNIIQGIIHKKLVSGSWMLPCHIIFILNFILIWKCQKWFLNRGALVWAAAICQMKCPFTVQSALFCTLFCSSGSCSMILDYAL